MHPNRHISGQRGIYLDYNATTPLDPAVLKAMEPYFMEHFGNPSSAGHHWGWSADSAVQKARAQVARSVGAQSQEIYFTSGASESNNWALFGLLTQLKQENPLGPIHVLTSTVEHSSIIKSFQAAQNLGIEVDFVPVNRSGVVELKEVEARLKPHTKLMSFIWINNEIGSINPIRELGQLAKSRQIYFHTDATQAIGKLPVHVIEDHIDLMSWSAHKIYGPKGVGALYIRAQNPKVQINPFIFGGGQERGLRSGTVNVPGVVGFGMASEIVQSFLNSECPRLKQLRNELWQNLEKNIPGLNLNGATLQDRACNNLNIRLPGIKTERLLSHLQKLGMSTGSACGTGSVTISHVLKGIGLSDDEVQCSLRLSLGRWNSLEDIQTITQVFTEALAKVR